MPMDGENHEGNESRLMTFPEKVEENLSHISLSRVPWTRGVAAASLIASAALLITGRRRAGLATAAAGATVALLENPDAVRDFWNSIPDYIHNGQDFLSRAEGLLDEVNRQSARVRDLLSRQG